MFGGQNLGQIEDEPILSPAAHTAIGILDTSS